MKRNCKIIAWLITIIMVLTMMPVNAFAKKIKLKNCTTKKVMAVGSTFVIKTNQKNSSLEFTSSKEKVVGVSEDGVINAKKKGRAVITITSGKHKKKIKITVKKPLGYTIGKKAGTYENAVQTKVKAKKKYVVYYTTSGKFKATKMIKSKKSKTFTFAKTTTLKLYVAKAKKKLSTAKLNKTKKAYNNYNEYLYEIESSTPQEDATATATATSVPEIMQTPVASEVPVQETPTPIPTPVPTLAVSLIQGDDAAADYVPPVLGQFDDVDKTTEAGADAVEITIPAVGSAGKVDNGSYTIKNNKVTIVVPGTYIIHTESITTPSDGLIEVDPTSEGLVHLILDGVNLTSSSNTAPDSDTGLITFKKTTTRAVLTVKDGTVNTLTDTGATGIDKDDGVSITYTGGINCKKTPLTINGAGTLNITTANGNGIKATDSLKIINTTITVNSSSETPAGHNGITGKKEVMLNNANLDVYADGDALKTTLDEVDIAEDPTLADLGNMDISGGTYKLVSANGDGISAYRTLNLNPTSMEVVTKNIARSTEDSSYKTIKAGTTINIPETAGTIVADTTATSIESDTENSYADDTLHCDGYIYINGGSLEMSSADDGIHANMGLLVSGGRVSVKQAEVGIEVADVSIYGGTVDITANGDGVNVGGGNDIIGDSEESFRKGQSATNANYQLIVKDGTLNVNAEGDGIDSNGNIFVLGGAVTVNGPTNGVKKALDYGDNNCICEISGGTLIAIGVAEMEDIPVLDSSQPIVNAKIPTTQSVGNYVVLKDVDGNAVLTVQPTKSFQSILISSDTLQLGSTYTVWYGTALDSLTQLTGE